MDKKINAWTIHNSSIQELNELKPQLASNPEALAILEVLIQSKAWHKTRDERDAESNRAAQSMQDHLNWCLYESERKRKIAELYLSRAGVSVP